MQMQTCFNFVSAEGLIYTYHTFKHFRYNVALVGGGSNAVMLMR